MLKLHIGCGLKYKSDYVNIDAYNDVVADEVMYAHELKYEDESVDLIESFQLVEHLGYMEAVLALGEWFRVLKTNSSIVVETPDIDKAFELYLKSNDHAQKALILNWIYGIPKKGYDHKFCFPAGLFRKLLIESGFVDIIDNYHEKTFGVPSYTFIAKKPLDVNPNNLVIHQLRKRLFKEIDLFNGFDAANYSMDFEKFVLGHTVDFAPRDFSVITFNELFTYCVTFSLKAARILVEESNRVGIVRDERSKELLTRIDLLESIKFTEYLYQEWQKSLFEHNNPEKATLIVIEIARNLAKRALFDAVLDEFKDHISQTFDGKTFQPIICQSVFSNFFIESTLSQMFAKYIKGTASADEVKICCALGINK